VSTLLEELGAIREKVVAQATKTIDVPGSGGTLAVKFVPPVGDDARDRLTGVVAVYRSGGALSADQELQLLVDCCDEVLHRNGSGKLEPYEDGNPLQFDASDERWGTDVTTARDCVRKLFNLDVQPLAAAGIADALIDWLQGLDAELSARAEKNSVAPPPEPS
jgi:hypothetical protein